MLGGGEDKGSEYSKTTHSHESYLFSLFCKNSSEVFYDVDKVNLDEFDEINFDKEKLI
jgi:hypothetical protein